MERAGDVRRPDVELRTIAVEERRVAAALFLRQHVDRRLELRVRGNRPALGQHLSALDFFFFRAAQQDADVVARGALVELEVRELLSKYNYAGDDAPVIRGAAIRAIEGDPQWVAKIQELYEALDTFIPQPVREVDKPFLLPVEDVFSITGRGTVATGRIERGRVKVGEEVELVGFEASKKSVVTGVEMFRKLLDSGEAGDNVGLLLRGIDKKEIERGMVLAKPGSIPPHTKFEAEVYVLTKEEGGRHTPFFKGYRPQFYFRTTDVTGSVELPEGTEMVMPGDNIQMVIELITPIAMEEQLRFAIREGGRTVGAGVVTKILK